MRISLILIVFSILSIHIPVHGQYDPDFFDNYTVVPGQPTLPAVGVFKDSQGFIWGCYIGGLYRFDGIRMKQYTRIPGDSTSLSDNLVRTILFEDTNPSTFCSKY